jgi:hypothetical protein
MADIKVNLRLGLEEMRKDLEEAKKALKAAMGVDLSKQVTSLERATVAQNTWASAIMRTTFAWKEMVSAMGTALPKMPKIPTPGNTGGGSSNPFNPIILPPPAQPTPFNKRQVIPGLPTPSGTSGGSGSSGTGQFLKNIGFAGLPMFNPGSPLSTLASFRQGFSALNTPFGTGMRGAMGRGLTAGGLPGLGSAVSAAGTSGSAAAAAVLTAAALGVGVALKGLMSVVRATAHAFEEAKKIYAKTMQSGGLPMGMVTQRSAVADAMGVSVEEMDRYANVVAYVGNTFKMSSEMLASTAPVLMGMSVNFSALGQDLKALGAELAYMLAPAINAVTIVIRGVILALAKIAEGFNWLFDQIYKGLKWVIELFPGGKAVTSKIGDIFRPTPDQPDAATKRLPASAWEKMGLVIGTGAGANYAKDTAANTKRIAEILSGRGSEKPAFNPGGMPMAFNGA